MGPEHGVHPGAVRLVLPGRGLPPNVSPQSRPLTQDNGPTFSPVHRLVVFEQCDIDVDDKSLELIESCTDLDTLNGWFRRAFKVGKASHLFQERRRTLTPAPDSGRPAG